MRGVSRLQQVGAKSEDECEDIEEVIWAFFIVGMMNGKLKAGSNGNSW